MTMVSAARRTPLLRKSPSLTGVFNRQCLRITPDVFTLDGFRAWVRADDFPEKVRVTFVDREIIIDMSNEEIQTHVAVKTEVSRMLSTLTRETDQGAFLNDGVLITNEEADVSNNPDATFVRWKSIEDGLVRVVPREGGHGQFTEIIGTPDWVLEVVSDSSVTKDTYELRDAYYRAGIPEYW